MAALDGLDDGAAAAELLAIADHSLDRHTLHALDVFLSRRLLRLQNRPLRLLYKVRALPRRETLEASHGGPDDCAMLSRGFFDHKWSRAAAGVCLRLGGAPQARERFAGRWRLLTSEHDAHEPSLAVATLDLKADGRVACEALLGGDGKLAKASHWLAFEGFLFFRTDAEWIMADATWRLRPRRPQEANQILVLSDGPGEPYAPPVIERHYEREPAWATTG